MRNVRSIILVMMCGQSLVMGHVHSNLIHEHLDNQGDVTLNSVINAALFLDYGDISGSFTTPTHLNIISGGAVVENLESYGKSSITMSSNSSTSSLSAHGDSSVTISGDVVIKNYIKAKNNSIVSISGNASVVVNDTGKNGNIYGNDYGVVSISGNASANYLEAAENSIITMHDNASIHGSIYAVQHGIIDIYVTDFKVDNVPIFEEVSLRNFGTFVESLPSSLNYTYGNISGHMEGGDAFSNDWRIYDTGDLTGTADINIHIVPEPTTSSLFTLSALTLLKRRKRT